MLKGTSKNSFWRAKCEAMKCRNRSVAALREDCDEASLQASLPPEWIFRGSLKSILLSATILMAFVGSSQAGNADYKNIPPVFFNNISGGMYVEQFVDQTLQIIRRNAKDGQKLTKNDVDRIHADELNQRRATQVSFLVQADADGDGKVTKTELLEFMSKQKGSDFQGEPQNDEILKNYMQLDADHNGIIDFNEMRKIDNSKQVAQVAIFDVQNFLELSPKKDGTLSAAELEKIARDSFAVIDKNHDGLIDGKEYSLFGEWLEKNTHPNETVADELRCELPNIDKKAKIVLFGTYEGYKISPIAIAGEDVETTASKIFIEAGSEPIYLILSSFESIVWQLEGATDRVSKVVLLSEQKSENIPSQAAVTGISKDKVAFVPAGDCFKYFSEQDSIEMVQAVAKIKSVLGHDVDFSSAAYTAKYISLPSSQLKEDAEQAPKVPEGFDGQSWSEALHYYSGGLADIKLKDVVSSVKAEPYTVLPNKMGIAQLVGKGVLKHLDGDDYKIVKPMDHYPAEMTGGLAVRFLLGKGISPPKGDLGHACVISEETGKSLDGNINCR